jgi:signal transduction histidine kinase
VSAHVSEHEGERQAPFLHQEDGHLLPLELLSHINSDGGGMGFRGMRERLRLLGGSLKIDSTRSGTLVTMTLPLEAGSVVEGHSEVACWDRCLRRG